jgi:hypothetical protein
MPHAYVTHSMPGRMRLHVPSKRNDAEYFERLGRELADVEGVDAVRTNARTGSVLVLHRRDLDSIRKFGIERGLFTIAAAAEAAMMLADRLSRKLDSIDDNVAAITRGNLDLRSTMLLMLAAGAAVQIWRKNLLPPAFNLLWYGLALIWPGGGKPRQ